MQINREKLAWSAGFIEGEGYIACSITRDPRAVSDAARQQCYPHMCVEVGQVNTEPIHTLAGILPGGNIVGPYKNANSSSFSIRYRTTKFEFAQAWIAMLWPWLSRKRKDQAKIALATFHELNTSRPRLKSGPPRKATSI